jgi:hypothetical protein
VSARHQRDDVPRGSDLREPALAAIPDEMVTTFVVAGTIS